MLPPIQNYYYNFFFLRNELELISIVCQLRIATSE